MIKGLIEVYFQEQYIRIMAESLRYLTDEKDTENSYAMWIFIS